MTGDGYLVERLAQFVVCAAHDDLRGDSLRAMKRNLLDSLACALGSLDGEMVPSVRAHARYFSSKPTATLIGGGKASVDQAAFFNAVLVRYPDLLDTYLTPGGLCHPADNLGAVLAVAEHTRAGGAEFLLALAVAYEVQCRFSAEVPLMAQGLNHALQLAMSVAAGTAKLLGLDVDRTADAISASSIDNISLAGVHAEPVAMWKGVSPAITGMRAVYATMLAQRGVTGPRALFEGPNGLDRLLGRTFDLRPADRSLDAAGHTYLKKYCALIHGQVIIDATLALREEHGFEGADVEHVVLDVFQGAFDFAGGGQYGNKDHPWTKEQADYNVKYLVAVALLDGGVGPAQLETSRVRQPDVQELLTRVAVVPSEEFTAAYPDRTQARVTLSLRGGEVLSRSQSDFEGSLTRPMSWDRVVDKFRWLAEPFAGEALCAEIIDAVDRLEHLEVVELARLLAAASPQALGAPRPTRF